MVQVKLDGATFEQTRKAAVPSVCRRWVCLVHVARCKHT